MEQALEKNHKEDLSENVIIVFSPVANNSNVQQLHLLSNFWCLDYFLALYFICKICRRKFEDADLFPEAIFFSSLLACQKMKLVSTCSGHNLERMITWGWTPNQTRHVFYSPLNVQFLLEDVAELGTPARPQNLKTVQI